MQRSDQQTQPTQSAGIEEIQEEIQFDPALQQRLADLEQALRQCRQTQAQQIQAEKMFGLGQIVAGIAHEINNPINFIHGNLNPAKHYIQDLLDLLRLYQQSFPQGTSAIQQQIEKMDLEFLEMDLPKLFNSIAVGTERIRSVVRSLHTFSRHDQAEMQVVDIHEGLESTLVILGNRLKAKSSRQPISVLKNYRSLPKLECYPGQLNQVFMNIINNAIDAIDECPRFLSEHLDVFPDHPKIQIDTELISDEWAKVSITDNGIGIPEATITQIFDPFFTTKPVGRGTGLGLSICYQIVTERHRGKLHCTSKWGQGTTLSLQIPLQLPI